MKIFETVKQQRKFKGSSGANLLFCFLCEDPEVLHKYPWVIIHQPLRKELSIRPVLKMRKRQRSLHITRIALHQLYANTQYTVRRNQEHSGNNKTFRFGFLSPNFRKKDPQTSWVKLVTIHFVIHASKNLLFLCIRGWKIWMHLHFNCYMKPTRYGHYSCFLFLILPEPAYAFSPVL